jgi:hypothetical protein
MTLQSTHSAVGAGSPDCGSSQSLLWLGSGAPDFAPLPDRERWTLVPALAVAVDVRLRTAQLLTGGLMPFMRPGSTDTLSPCGASPDSKSLFAQNI